MARTTDMAFALAMAGLVYGLIVSPLFLSACAPTDLECAHASRPENKVVWPLLASASVYLIAANWSRIAVPPHIAWLFAFLGYAGLSVLWALDPEISAIRYAQEVMVITTMTLPALIMGGRGDLLRGMFWCFALASVINVFFLFGPPPVLAHHATPGLTGYFQGKNYLGIFAALTLLLSFHEMTHRGARRWSGLAVAFVAIALLVLSNAKTALGLALLAPVLAIVTVLVRRAVRVSILIVPLTIVALYLVAAVVANIDIYKISYQLYGESTFTGRKWIWMFAELQISEKPLLGWGYQSFWLVGLDATSVAGAQGWIKSMPNAHNGYLDVTLELGYVGLAFLLVFVGMTWHLAGRMVDRDPRRGWIIVTLMYFVVLINGLESYWMRAFEFPWLVFLIVAADIGRHLNAYPAAIGHPLTRARPMASSRGRAFEQVPRRTARPAARPARHR